MVVVGRQTTSRRPPSDAGMDEQEGVKQYRNPSLTRVRQKNPEAYAGSAVEDVGFTDSLPASLM